jgi:hypothetical protein
MPRHRRRRRRRRRRRGRRRRGRRRRSYISNATMNLNDERKKTRHHSLVGRDCGISRKTSVSTPSFVGENQSTNFSKMKQQC